MNEKGFAVGVLKLDGKPTLQSDAGKIHISTTVAMRMLLDRVATVDDAIKMLEEYNMSMDLVAADASFHYFMAEAGGNYAMLRYVDPTEGHPGNPYKMEVLAATTHCAAWPVSMCPTLCLTPSTEASLIPAGCGTISCADVSRLSAHICRGHGLASRGRRRS